MARNLVDYGRWIGIKIAINEIITLKLFLDHEHFGFGFMVSVGRRST